MGTSGQGGSVGLSLVFDAFIRLWTREVLPAPLNPILHLSLALTASGIRNPDFQNLMEGLYLISLYTQRSRPALTAPQILLHNNARRGFVCLLAGTTPHLTRAPRNYKTWVATAVGSR
jgi:hypothetical protein